MVGQQYRQILAINNHIDHDGETYLLTRAIRENQVWTYRKSLSCRFPKLFRELESKKADLGITGYGVAETTLEEVFLAATKQRPDFDANQKGIFEDDTVLPIDDEEINGNSDDQDVRLNLDNYEGDRRRPERLMVCHSRINRFPC